MKNDWTRQTESRLHWQNLLLADIRYFAYNGKLSQADQIKKTILLKNKTSHVPDGNVITAILTYFKYMTTRNAPAWRLESKPWCYSVNVRKWLGLLYWSQYPILCFLLIRTIVLPLNKKFVLCQLTNFPWDPIVEFRTFPVNWKESKKFNAALR